MDTIKELEQRAKRESNEHKTRLRQNYGYARFLGFTPAQAKIMSGWSRSHITECRSLIRKNQRINPRKEIEKI